MTVDHILKRCLKLATLREEIWPNRSPGAIVWQPGAAPPDNNVHYCGRTVHLRMQKEEKKKSMKT
jgi:hypothetical protein